MMLRLFVRQSFTGAKESEQAKVQEVLDTLLALRAEHPHVLITGNKAQNANTFRTEFETRNGQPFTPKAFRDERLRLLQSAHAMIIVRTGLSESSAFEIAYNIYSGLKLPMFFAISTEAPIKTTLLQNLDDLAYVRYHVFDEAAALCMPLSVFLTTVSLRS